MKSHALSREIAVQIMEMDDSGDVIATLSDCLRALKRVAKRAKVPAGMERVEIAQSRGPTVEMTARLLCETEFDSKGREPIRIRLELWETEAGALVAVTHSEPAHGRPITTLTVVEPSDDVQAMRFAAMEQWDWHDRARSMVRKLGWSLRQEVE